MNFEEATKKYGDAMNEYLNTGYSIRDLADKNGLVRSVFTGFLLANGIDVYSRKSHVNDYIFSKIDNEEKAYWLGFLYADGSVCKFKKSQYVELSLKESDVEHLRKFAKFMGYPFEPKYREKQKAYRVQFGSRRVCESLIKLGCTHKKSLTLKFPIEEQVPNELLRHFIRGYFDGDGCLSIKEYAFKKSPKVTILGTIEFLTSLRNYLNLGEIPIKKCKNNDSNNYYMMFNVEDARKFLHYIYDNANIFLQRKYDKFLEVIPYD